MTDTPRASAASDEVVVKRDDVLDAVEALERIGAVSDRRKLTICRLRAALEANP